MDKERNRETKTTIKWYSIYFDNTFIKQYPTKLQCIIYCIINKQAYQSKGLIWLDPRVNIKLEEKKINE